MVIINLKSIIKLPLFALYQKLGSSFFLFSFLSFLFVGCLGEKGQKEAECPVGQKFNSVTRKCVIAQGAPRPLLSSLVFEQDQDHEEFVINYTDIEGNSAFACHIEMESGSSVFSIRAKEYFQARDEAEEIKELAFETYLQISDPGLSAQASDIYDDIEATYKNLLAVEKTQKVTSILNALADYVEQLGEIAQQDDEAPAVVRGRLLVEEAENLREFSSLVSQRCSCSGSVCRAVYVGKKGQYGEGGFSYTLQDEIGISSPKSVGVFVQRINTPPMPTHLERTYPQSLTSDSPVYSFSVPSAVDKDFDLFQPISYEIVSPSNGQLDNGTIQGCLGINGASGRNCQYIPSDGNTYGDLGAPAQASLGDVTFVASSPGQWGNDIEVYVHQNPIIRTGGSSIFGGTSSGGADNVIIEIDGSRIDFWVDLTPTETIEGITYYPTSTEDLEEAISNHIYASRMIELDYPMSSDLSLGEVNLSGGENGLDTFTYRVHDGEDSGHIYGHVSLAIDYHDNRPKPALGSFSLEEYEQEEIELSFIDTDTPDVSSCEVETGPEIMTMNRCSCDVSSCHVTLRPRPGVGPSSSYIEYNIETPIRDSEGNLTGDSQYFAGGAQTVTVEIIANPIDTSPLIVHEEAKKDGDDLYESTTPIPPENGYTLDSFSELVTVYSSTADSIITGAEFNLVTHPEMGELSGCYNEGSFDPTEDCIYTPFDGNLNSSDLPQDGFSEFSFAGLNLRARTRGTHADNIKFEFICVQDIDGDDVIIEPYYLDGNLNFDVYYGVDTVRSDLASAIDTHDYSQKIFELTGDPGTFDTHIGNNCTDSIPYNPNNPITSSFSGGSDGFDFFEFQASDGGGSFGDFLGRVPIFMIETDNEPLICQYSGADVAPECGVKGCRGGGHPYLDNEIKPVNAEHPIVYFDHEHERCFKSNSDPDKDYWEIINSNIFDVVVSEKSEIVIDHIAIADGLIDSEDFVLKEVHSSNTAVVPTEQIEFFYNDDQVVFTGGEATESIEGDGEDLAEMEIRIQPAGA